MSSKPSLGSLPSSPAEVMMSTSTNPTTRNSGTMVGLLIVAALLAVSVKVGGGSPEPANTHSSKPKATSTTRPKTAPSPSPSGRKVRVRFEVELDALDYWDHSKVGGIVHYDLAESKNRHTFDRTDRRTDSVNVDEVRWFADRDTRAGQTVNLFAIFHNLDELPVVLSIKCLIKIRQPNGVYRVIAEDSWPGQDPYACITKAVVPVS